MSIRISLPCLSESSPTLTALSRVGAMVQVESKSLVNMNMEALLNKERGGIHQILAVKFVYHLTTHNTPNI